MKPNKVIKENSLDRIYILSALILTGLFILRYADFLDTWMATQYLFSFYDGFLSRAFLGSIFHLVIPSQRGNIYFLNVFVNIVLISLCFLMIYVSYSYWKKNRNIQSLLLTFVFLSSPGTMQFFANDLGRFDGMGYIIAILAGYMIKSLSANRAVFVVGAVSIILVVIHEVLFVTIVPFLMLLFILSNPRFGLKENLKLFTMLLIGILPAMILAILMLTFFRIENMEMLTMLEMQLQSFSNFEISEPSLMVQFRSIKGNMEYTSYLFNPKGLGSIIVAFFSLLPSLIIGFYGLYKVFRNKLNSFFVFYAACFLLFCPLFPCVLGADYPRWLASVLMNSFLVLLITGQRLNTHNKLYFNYILFTIIIYSIASGPIFHGNGPEIFMKPLKETYNIFIN